MKVVLNIILPLSLLSTPLAVYPQVNLTDDENIEVSGEDEEHDRAVMENPVVIPDETDDIDIPIPGFIKRNVNHIILNGSDWSKLKHAFESSKKRPVSIVHIGDSHVQADINTGTIRELLQYDFGNAGRGLITPLKMCATNQPSDYTFQSRNSWNSVKLMNPSWAQTVGFTGSSIRPVSASSEITLGTSEADDYNPFSSLTLFHNGKLSIKEITDENGNSLRYRAIPSRDYTQILLTTLATKVNISFNSAGDLTLYGASLSGDRPGVFYHSIGNNGATFSSYNRIGTVGIGINPLIPDLVVISLGTNEAFGRSVNVATFSNSVDNLVKNIRSANPNALILLTTPMECHRSVTSSKKTRVKVKTRKGRKQRYKTVVKTSRTYAVNSNIAPIRQAILDYGKKNGIAVYDWYEVAGGRGASDQWIRSNLFAKDRVHHTRQGYSLEGRLLYDAIMDSLRN